MNGAAFLSPQGLSVRSRMSEVLARLEAGTAYRFSELLDPAEGREGLAVTFLALLELAKGHMVELVQVEPLHPLYVRVP